MRKRPGAVEAVYTTADVIAQRDALLEMVSPRPGERVLDLGSQAPVS